MLVEVIKKQVDYLGKRGAVRDIPENEAQVHIMLGNVKPYEPPRVEPVTRAKRSYRRRDVKPDEKVVMEAESEETEVETEEIIPSVEEVHVAEDDSTE